MNMKHRKKIVTGISALLILSLVVGLANLHPQKVRAAGDAYFTISPSSGSYSNGATFTVNVYETSTSGDQVAGVQANLTYNTTYLQCNSATGNSAAWSYVAQATCSGGNIELGEAMTTGGPVASGQQLVGTVSFTVIGLSATSSSGSANASLISGGSGQATDILNLSTTSVWNGATPTATFALSGPAPVSTPPPGNSGGSSGSAGSTSKSSGSTSKPTTTTPATSSTPTSASPTTSTTTPAPSTTKSATKPVSSALTVTVTDSSGKPVKDAKVLVGSELSAYTNGQGTVLFSGITDGSYTVTVTAPGKKPTTLKVTLTASKDKMVVLKLVSNSSSLLPIVYVIAGLVIVGGAGFGYLRLSGRELGVLRRFHPFLRAPTQPIPASGIVVGSGTSPMSSSAQGNTGTMNTPGVSGAPQPSASGQPQPTVIQSQQPSTPPNNTTPRISG